MSGPAVSLVIADDQTLFRCGLAGLLDDGDRIRVVGLAADGVEAVRLCESLDPDVILMDLKMPGMDGLEATERIVASSAHTKVLMLTTFESDAQVLAALRAGASGYVLKDSKPEAIASSVVLVNLGEQVMTSAVGSRVLEMASGGGPPRGRPNGLTPRELEILCLVGAGAGNKQIAESLSISDKTVRNHVSHMYEKLQIGDRSQAVLYALRAGLVEL